MEEIPKYAYPVNLRVLFGKLFEILQQVSIQDETGPEDIGRELDWQLHKAGPRPLSSPVELGFGVYRHRIFPLQ